MLYDSLFTPLLWDATGSFIVDRLGQPAESFCNFIVEFKVLDDPVTIATTLNATYERSSGPPDPVASHGKIELERSIPNFPHPVIIENLFKHPFEMGAEGDLVEAFSDTRVLTPGAYHLRFDIGLPGLPPDWTNWDVAGTSTARSDALNFDFQVRFTPAGGSAIPLPPALVPGAAMLAALAACRGLRATRRARPRAGDGGRGDRLLIR